jgi:ABC-2 type transport system permease protein
LFLRGRSARGLQKKGAPQSVSAKLGTILSVYVLVGLMALQFLRQPVFILAICLHAMTVVFLGMFVAASSGEILFNKEEADILLHRPVTPKALLWARILVLVKVSLWTAGALNLAGLFVGLAAPDGGLLFPLAHAISTTLEALFCAGSVVVLYQLCLRWFGRERLDGLMTSAQVAVVIAAVLAGQIPQLLTRFNGKFALDVHAWWVCLLPPAWFAGFDDLIAGSRSGSALALALAGVLATVVILWQAFVKLAADYEAGLQTLGEAVPPKCSRGGRRRWLDELAGCAPLRWWLRDPVSRASFLLVGTYLIRDRDVKLRVYPGLAPLLVWPVLMVIQGRAIGKDVGFSPLAGFFNAFSGVYIGIVPLLALDLLRYSQQWLAADLFRAAPMRGPGPLCDGARRAVLLIITVPLLAFVTLLARLFGNGISQLPLLLPGIIGFPVYAMIGCRGGKAVPLSLPNEEAKPVGRGLTMIAVMALSAVFALVATLSWNYGWFKWLLGAEFILAIALYFVLRASVNEARWSSIE